MASHIGRRKFLATLGGAAAAWPFAARAQESARSVRIGLLVASPLPPVERFLRKLQQYGYVEGRNLRLESRFAEGRDDRYPALAAELVALPVDIIVTWGTPATIAAQRATSTIPIVMGAIADPVSVGIVSNLSRPGGNVTGFATQNVDVETKRLELLKELIPQCVRLGILGNVSNPYLAAVVPRLRAAAQQLGVALDMVEVRGADEVPGALARLENIRPDGVLVPADIQLLTRRSDIAAAFAKMRLPAVYAIREHAAAGGLIAHGANLSVLFEHAAGYVDRILKGTRPADLPVQLATEFELIVNLKAAAAIGLTIPATLLARADEVIE
jgi:putative tryptophan/tyrosine transport system substrate-binding protein